MATIVRRRGKYLARIRLSNLAPVSKAFDTHKDAKQWATSREDELRQKRGTVRRDVTTLTIGQLIHDYLDDPETRKLRSFADTSQRLAYFVARVGEQRCLEFGALNLRDLRAKLIAGKRGPATINRYLSCLRSCWNFGLAAGLIPPGHAWPKRLLLSEPAGRLRYLADSEIQAVLKATAPDPVMAAAFVVAVGTGVRRSELLALRWQDINLDGAKLTVRHSKTDKPRRLHLPRAAVDALRKLKTAPVVSASSVFVNLSGSPLGKSLLEHRWSEIRKAAGLTNYHWHDHRHTFASVQLQNGTSLHDLKEMMGHSSFAMVMRYAHLVQGERRPGHDALDNALVLKQ